MDAAKRSLNPAKNDPKDLISSIPCYDCIYTVRYEWDERKNLENQRKHEGISFELASLVFEDKRCLIGLDRVDESGEQR